MRIERDTVPEGKYQYKGGGDDDSGSKSARIWNKVFQKTCRDRQIMSSSKVIMCIYYFGGELLCHN